jgi:hypothetical protein
VSKTRFVFLATLVLLCAVAIPAGATITTDTSSSNVFQQTLNHPCVVGDPSCNQSGLVYNSQSGPSNPYDFSSPFYLAGSGISAPATIVSIFNVGVDDNLSTGGGLENLVFFKTFDCGTSAPGTFGTATPGTGCVLDANNSFTPQSPFAIPDNHNGNGFSDMTLNGFVLIPGNYYYFEVSVTNDSDGMEEFFLIPQGDNPIPEPATLALFGSGLAGLAGVVRRRLKK